MHESTTHVAREASTTPLFQPVRIRRYDLPHRIVMLSLRHDCGGALHAQGRRHWGVAFMLYNQAIVIPETIDAIRALTGTTPDGAVSIATTNRALGIGRWS